MSTQLFRIVPLALLVACARETVDSDPPADDPEEPNDTGDTGAFGPAEWPDLGDISGNPDVTGLLPTDLPAVLVATDLGVHTVTAGFTESFTFTAHAATTSFTVVTIGHRGTTTFLAAAYAPDGAEVVAFDAEATLTVAEQTYYGPLASAGRSANRVIPRSWRSATMVPNAPRVPFAAGEWKFRVGSWQVDDRETGIEEARPLDTAVRVLIVERREEPAVELELDLALHFDGSNGLTAASAPTDTDLANALARFDEAFAPAGLRVGNVTYHELPAAVGGVIGLDPPTCMRGDDVDALMDESVAPAGALPVFFVEQFTCPRGWVDAGAGLGGISNGLPGLPWAPRDGVVMTTWPIEDYPVDWEKVMAHEIGHFLGLFHPHEAEPSLVDGLDDTPTTGTEDNLMHWNASADPDAHALTEEQVQVLRTHPLLRALPAN